MDRGAGDRGAEDRSPDRGPGADGPMGADLAISKDFCTGWCGFRGRCQGYSLSLCMAQCQKPSAVLKQKFQPIVAETLAICFSTLACSKSDDTCWNQALLASDPGCFSNATVTACVSKRKACSQGDDICYYYCGLQASGQAAFSACLGASCSELEACLTPLTSIK